MRHPVVVCLHGNFFFWPAHWQAAIVYRDAGFVIFTPMLRGENGNPGDFELMYGEVDDVIAAGNFVARLPYVDTHRIFLSGHSVGGTLTMLAAMMPSPYRAAVAISGAPDQKLWVQDQDSATKVYAIDDPREVRLRSPMYFPGSIRCPLYLYDGDQEDYFIPTTRQLALDAKKMGKICEFDTVPGDHNAAKVLGIQRSISIFLGYK
jgi:dipeptidyl aminopeptidase/acylaminoacyl peptidase